MKNHLKGPDAEETDPSGGRFDHIWLTLTVLVMLAVIFVIGSSLLIFFNPNTALNPFPPPTLPPLAQLPSSTPTDVLYAMPSTWTPTPPEKPTATPIPTATPTLPSTPTPITVTASPTHEPATPAGGYPYQVRPGNPQAVPNQFHLESACGWMGVAGNVVDLSNSPVTGLVIKLGGELPGGSFSEDAISLSGLALNYGQSGYEFTLSDRPIASSGQLWLQITSPSGEPLSEKVYFDTYGSCEQNLILVNFVQVR